MDHISTEILRWQRPFQLYVRRMKWWGWFYHTKILQTDSMRKDGMNLEGNGEVKFQRFKRSASTLSVPLIWEVSISTFRVLLSWPNFSKIYTSIDPKQQHPFFQESDLPFREFMFPPYNLFLWGKKEKKSGETNPGSLVGTRRNQEIKMEQNPCPEGKRNRETSPGTLAGLRSNQ